MIVSPLATTSGTAVLHQCSTTWSGKLSMISKNTGMSESEDRSPPSIA